MKQFLTATAAENGIGIAPVAIFDSRRASVPVASASKLEFTLLLTIARVELHTDEQGLLRDLLGQPLDWEYLLAMAELHGLEPLLFHHLHESADEVVPQRVMQMLRNNCKAIALRNLVLSAKLREISAHLTSFQIEHISYKGPLLAEMYGGNGALRTYHDLDFLVPQAKLVAARDALREVGFGDKYGLTAAQQATSFCLGFEHPFSSKAGIDLDIHWRIVQQFKSRLLDMDGIWKRSVKARLMDRDVPALCHEDLLVVLCLHAGHHGWMQLSHMCDLAQLFRVHQKFDWKVVRSHLGDSNTMRIVSISLYLLQKHWHVQIPEEMMVTVSADRHVERLAHRIEVEIWPAEEPTLTTSSLQWMLERTAGESLHDRMRLLAGSVFVPSMEDFVLFRLPLALSPFYAGLRILRLACRCASSRWHRWWRKEVPQRRHRNQKTFNAGSGLQLT